MSPISKNLNKNKKIVVGVSGGPDSMALLDMVFSQGFECHVVHVNYHKRESARIDQNIVEDYCQKNKINLYVFDDFKMDSGNFQAQAREYRYRCYKEIYQKVNAMGLYLGHHLNDHLETIVFQLQSHRTPKYLGLKEKSLVDNMNVYRPLLDMTKDELLKYCQRKNIKYGIDETNFEPIYTRNKIRYALRKLSEQDKQSLLSYAKEYDRSSIIKIKAAQDFLNDREKIDIDSYKNYNLEQRLVILREFLIRVDGVDQSISRKALLSLDEKMLSKKHQLIQLNSDLNLLIQYNNLIIHPVLSYEFSVKFDRICYVNHARFQTVSSGSDAYGCTLSPSDFPIIIRNARANDKIVMRFGTKRVSRFFIDRKIPYLERLKWPVIENKDKEVVFVMGLGCDKYHYSLNHNLYLYPSEGSQNA